MTTNLNLKYSITFNAATKVIDDSGEFSSEDVIQQQLLFNSNSLYKSSAKRIEIQLLPTSYVTPSSARIYDIDLEALNLNYLRMIYIKSEYQFLFSTADTITNLNNATRQLSQVYVLDTGIMPPSNIFNPDIIYPKYIRLINPLEINGGGSGNSDTDIPLLVSVFLVETPITADAV